MINRDSVRFVYGTDVYGTGDQKIGSAGQVYLDNDTGAPAWVAVRTGLFGRKESFVPLQDATLTEDRLEVPFGKDQVKHAPRVDEDGELSPADEDELYRYYESLAQGDRVESDRAGERDKDERNESDGTTGHDDAMTRSEERLVVKGTRTEETGKARLRKYVVTEERQVTVPVRREEVHLEQEPAGNASPARHAAEPADAPDRGAEAEAAGHDREPTMTLWAEEPVVTTRSVPVEQVRLRKDTVTGQQTVTGEVRKERIDLEDDTGR